MENPIRIFKSKDGKTLKIYQDENPESPREWDNMGIMVCWHSRYNLGDKNNFKSPGDFQEWLKNNPAIVLPLYLLDHSGITISTRDFKDSWDSGQVGYIYVTHKKIKEEYGKVTKATKARAEKMLRSEVETYDQYLRSAVYGFVVEAKPKKYPCCGHETIEQLDSCWGFYGYDPKTNGMFVHVGDKWEEVSK